MSTAATLVCLAGLASGVGHAFYLLLLLGVIGRVGGNRRFALALCWPALAGLPIVILIWWGLPWADSRVGEGSIVSDCFVALWAFPIVSFAMWYYRTHPDPFLNWWKRRE